MTEPVALPQRRPRPTARELAHEIGHGGRGPTALRVLNEFGDFPRMRRMLFGIRASAETQEARPE